MEQQKRIKEMLEQENSASGRASTGNVASAAGSKEDTESKEDIERYLYGFVIHQSVGEISVQFDVPYEIRAKDVSAKFSVRTMRVELAGMEKPLFDGMLFGSIEPRESCWEIEESKEGKKLVVTLVKNPHGQWDQFEDDNPDSKFNVPQNLAIRRLRANVDQLQTQLKDAQIRMSKYGEKLAEKDKLQAATGGDVQQLKGLAEELIHLLDTISGVTLSTTEANLDRDQDSLLHAVKANLKLLMEVQKGLERAIMKAGATKIDVTEGSAYNPQFHRVANENDWDVSGEISKILEDGYQHNGHVLRKSLVKVTRKSL